MQIHIKDKVEYFPVLVDNMFEGRIHPETGKVTWQANLFANIDASYTQEEINKIEDNILNLFNKIKNERK